MRRVMIPPWPMWEVGGRCPSRVGTSPVGEHIGWAYVFGEGNPALSGKDHLAYVCSVCGRGVAPIYAAWTSR